MIDRSVHREGQVFWFRVGVDKIDPTSLNIFLVLGKTYHEESNQEVWLVLDLETGEENYFSEDFLRIKAASSRYA